MTPDFPARWSRVPMVAQVLARGDTVVWRGADFGTETVETVRVGKAARSSRRRQDAPARTASPATSQVGLRCPPAGMLETRRAPS